MPADGAPDKRQAAIDQAKHTAEILAGIQTECLRLERDGKVFHYVLPAGAEASAGRLYRVTYGQLLDYCVCKLETAEELCRNHPESRMHQHDRAVFHQLGHLVRACGDSDVIKAELRAIARRVAAEVAAEAVPAGEDGADQEPAS